MPEPHQNDMDFGLTELSKRLSAVGIKIIEQQTTQGFQRPVYFLIGNTAHQTDFSLSHNFLKDLPNTREYQAKVDSYARAVAGRLKCGSPELFYCLSGKAVRVSIRWPIQGAVWQGQPKSFVIMEVIDQADKRLAKCSMEVTHNVFDIIIQTVNSVRTAIDNGLVSFYDPDVWQERFQRIDRQEQPCPRHTQSEIEKFLIGKAYTLGFLSVDEPSEIWAADPWDALYLGVSTKDLLLAMRVLRANGMFHSGSSADYVKATDKLLAEVSAESEKSDNGPFAQPQQIVSRLNLPNKDELLKDMRTVLEKHALSALVVIDLDHFKTVNDTKGHSEGDSCLDRVVKTIGIVVGRKGKIYRWGGDEFAVCLPDFSTDEAQVTAERIRREVEQANPGGDIAVTTSIGVCGSDRTDSRSAEQILDFADKAMYVSKRLGKNRVTAWQISQKASS